VKTTQSQASRGALVIVPALWLAGSIAVAQQASPAPAAPVLQGRVVAEGSSEPIARARVTVLSSDGPRAPVFSDADGRFAAAVPAGGTFRLRVAKAGFIRKEIAGAPSLAPATDIPLTRNAVIAGRLLSSDGEPRARAGVSVRPSGIANRPAGTPNATTDDLGEFRVSGLVAGRYTVSSGQTLSCTNDGSQTTCSVLPTATQEVDLREGDEVTVSLVVRQTESSTPLLTVSNNGAVVEMRGVINDNARRANTASIATLSGKGAGNPAPSGTIRGRVTANGAPVAGASVRFARGDPASAGSFWMDGAITDAEGRYEIPGVPAGRFHLTADSGALASASIAGSPHTNTITVSEGEQVNGVDISLRRPGVITGTIVDEAGEPIEGLTVRALRARFVDGRVQLSEVEDSPVRTTNDRGQYRIFGLAPGSYHIVATEAPSPVIPGGPPVYASLQVFYPGRTSAAEALALQVDAEAVVAGIDVMFAPYQGGRIVGHARLSSGRPFNGTAVLVHSARTGVLASEPRAVPIQDGRFEFLHVAPGDYVVQAAAWKTWEISEEFGAAPVRVGGQEAAALSVTTTPPSMLSGTIRLEGERGSASLVDFQLRTVPADPDLALALPSVEPALAERVDVRADGRFTITGLAGPRRITATAPAGWWLKSAVIDGIDAADDPFTFGPGAARHTNVDVVFATGAVTISGRVTNSRAEPLAGYPVILFPADASRIYPGSRYFGMTHSDRQGRFSLPNLTPGDYSVVAVDAVLEADDWQYPGVLNSLATQARRVTARPGTRATVDLQPTPLAR
jgi:protocatechuate 3,4-dioxygenase beta subunit